LVTLLILEQEKSLWEILEPLGFTTAPFEIQPNPGRAGQFVYARDYTVVYLESGQPVAHQGRIDLSEISSVFLLGSFGL
jgi:hypothetical protein